MSYTSATFMLPQFYNPALPSQRPRQPFPTWIFPLDNVDPSQNFLRPTPAHTRSRGPSSRAGMRIRRRRRPEPAHINTNLTQALPTTYDQALYLANYWRHISSYLALHLLIVNNTGIICQSVICPATDGYRTMLANTIWSDGLPETHDLPVFDMLSTLNPYLMTLIPLPVATAMR